MPRKVDPRWGEDGYEESPVPVTLDEADMEVFVKMLGIDPAPSEEHDLRSAVIDIGNTYRRWNGRGAGAFGRDQARRAIEDLLVAGYADYSALTALNERAFQSILDSLLMMKPAPIATGDSVLSALTEGRLDERTLRKAMRAAIDRLKATKGRDREAEIAWAVAELCQLYEEVTGQRATHSSKGEHMAYEQEPQSKAGRFARACFRSIDEKVDGAGISRGMRHFIKYRK